MSSENKVYIDGVCINPDNAPLITTYPSGLYVNPLDLRPELVRVEDIAHHLGNLTRYTGATKFFYPVAQHAIYVAQLVEEAAPDLAFAALHHDDQEYVLNDVSRPIKYDEYYGKAIRGAQKRAEQVIMSVLGIELSQEHHDLIKAADMMMLATERDQLLPPGAEWEIVKGVARADIEIKPWTAKKATRRFLARHKELLNAQQEVGAGPDQA